MYPINGTRKKMHNDPPRSRAKTPGKCFDGKRIFLLTRRKSNHHCNCTSVTKHCRGGIFTHKPRYEANLFRQKHRSKHHREWGSVGTRKRSRRRKRRNVPSPTTVSQICLKDMRWNQIGGFWGR